MFVSSYSSAAYIKPTTDPTAIGIGARPIGMGKAYVALSDDVNAVYMNPAGLAQLKSWQFTSMTTKLINEIDYISLAGTYNTDYGTFGLGYVGANISGSFVTGLTLVEDRGIIFPVVSQDAISYTSSVILLCYGSNAKRFINYDLLDKVSVGATLKLFTQGLSGGGISEGLLSGYDMDFGMLYKPLTYLSLGWNQIDALPVTWGGKLVDASGERVENLPTITKMGLALKILGENDALYSYPQPLTFLFDFDWMPTRSGVPVTYRTGFEWWPSVYLALRLGLDQDIVGTDTSSTYGVDSNLTAGAGVYYNGFKFDFAYHKYGDVSENDTNYISLSYASPLEIPKPKEVIVKQDYLILYSPKDRTTTYDEAADIKGTLNNLSEITALNINGADVAYSPSGTFEATYPLALGKNPFKVLAMHGNTVLASAEVRLLRLASFKDVPDKYWAKQPIEDLATLGIIGGYPDSTFRPGKSISRAELTTLLVKTKGYGSTESEETGFRDVKKSHWASFYVKSGIDLKMITGYPDKTFKPSRPLNRAEGVVIAARFSQLKEPDLILEGPFPDVPGRHWAAKSITAARSAGLLVFLTDKPFEPNKELTRAEAAEILSRTPYAAAKIDDLKNFDTY